MDITLSGDQMQALVAKAIFDAMTPEAREAMMVKAIQKLMTPEPTGYGNRKASPIEDAFQSAARMVAERVARERLETDETFKAQIESLFSDVAKKLFASSIREQLVGGIADAVIKGLNPRDY